jgi:hypothetical protein
MAKNNTQQFDFEVLEENPAEVNIEQRLGRLWATAARRYRPNTTLQHEFAAMDLEPYPDLSADMAMALWQKESKTFKRGRGVSKWFENQLRENDVTICVDHVIINDQPIVPEGGSLETLNSASTTARDCANLITLYTKVKGEGADVLVTSVAEDKVYSKAAMPALKATTLRKMLKNTTPDPVRARDEMYVKLIAKDGLAAMIYCTYSLYSNEKLKPFRVSSPKVLAKYKSEVKKMVAQAVKEGLPVPKWPDIKDAYYLQQADFEYYTVEGKDTVWRFFMTSTNARGGQKHQGALTRGYYRFDISPPLVNDIEEATDVIMIANKYKYTAVMLEIADVKLAMILNYNNITVYCSALNSVKETNKNVVGTYCRGSRRYFIYRAVDQDFPSVKKHDVTMPNPVSITTNIATFVMEYIPHVGQANMNYLPSCRAALGLCIKTNQHMKKDQAADLNVLRNRFCTAVYYRNWFLITRYTYVSQDPYRNWFNTAWTLPKIKEDITEDYFALGQKMVVKTNGTRPVDLAFTEQELGEEIPPPSRLTDVEVEELLAMMRKSTRDELEELHMLVTDAALPANNKYYQLYLEYEQETLEIIIKTMIDNLKTTPQVSSDSSHSSSSKKKKIQVDKDNSSSSSSGDVFEGAQRRVVKKKDGTSAEPSVEEKKEDDNLI